MKMLKVVISALLLTPSLVFASDWRAIGHGGDLTFYVDGFSITKTSDHVMKFWVKGVKDLKSRGIWAYTVQHWEINCANHSMRSLDSTEYRINGIAVSSNPTPYAAFEDIIPDSISQTIEERVCK